MIPQVLVWVFLIYATVVSVFRDMTLGYLNIATVWNGINLLALTAVRLRPTSNRGAALRALRETRRPARPRDAHAAWEAQAEQIGR